MDPIDQTPTSSEQAWFQHLHRRDWVVEQVLLSHPNVARSDVERLYDAAMDGRALLEQRAAPLAAERFATRDVTGHVPATPARSPAGWPKDWSVRVALAGIALAALGLANHAAEAGITAAPAAPTVMVSAQ